VEREQEFEEECKRPLVFLTNPSHFLLLPTGGEEEV
jgi:hypothetical protein